jgi:hypothetical protein
MNDDSLMNRFLFYRYFCEYDNSKKVLENFKKVVTNGKDSLLKNLKDFCPVSTKNRLLRPNIKQKTSKSSTGLGFNKLDEEKNEESPEKRLKHRLLSQPEQELTDERLNKFVVFEAINNYFI